MLSERSTKVLDGMSFRVPDGSRVALVGPSGAGKSTVLQLIERFYEIDDGAIRVEGQDIRELPRTMLRSKIGYVEQDAPALSGTLRSNLTLGSPSATDADCIDALRRANLLVLADRHPAGLSMEVGSSGVTLSGGERQRLAIARALLANLPILLLDESTSSLDSRNERILQAAIDEFSKDRTVLVVAHRLSTVIGSDLIIVIDQGRVVGQGSHEDLIPPLQGAQIRRIDGVMHLVGLEKVGSDGRHERGHRFKQSWLCATDEAQAMAFLDRVTHETEDPFEAADYLEDRPAPDWVPPTL